jgi:hypothetical protein
MPVDSKFTSVNSSFVNLITPLPTGSSEKENVPLLVDVGDRSTMDWDKVNCTGWECEEKGKAKDDEGGKDTTTTPRATRQDLEEARRKEEAEEVEKGAAASALEFL